MCCILVNGETGETLRMSQSQHQGILQSKLFGLSENTTISAIVGGITIAIVCTYIYILYFQLLLHYICTNIYI